MIPDELRVVITGAGQGIGRALARHFLAKGHRVFLIDINEEELKYTANEHLKKFTRPGRVGWKVCDLGDPEQIRSAIEEAAKLFDNQIDALINNGGISSPNWPDGKTMEDKSTLDLWYKYMYINLTAPFVVSQACLPYMKVDLHQERQSRRNPCIIHMSSFRAAISDPNQEGYASSKAGLSGLTQSMAISMKAYGIRVNLIAPGRIKATHESKNGDMNGAQWENTDDDKNLHATNRAGEPSDICEAAEYLIGAGFVTGQEIFVDGGVSKMKASAVG